MDISEKLKKTAKNAVLPIAVMFGGNANAEPVQVPEPSGKQIISNEVGISDNSDFNLQNLVKISDESIDITKSEQIYHSLIGFSSYFKKIPDIYLDKSNSSNSPEMKITKIGNEEILSFNLVALEKYLNVTKIDRNNPHGLSNNFFDKYTEIAKKTGIEPPTLFYYDETSHHKGNGIASANYDLGVIFVGRVLFDDVKKDESKILSVIAHESGHIKHLGENNFINEREADCNAVKLGYINKLTSVLSEDLSKTIKNPSESHGSVNYREKSALLSFKWVN